jgi:hypothetical protein
MRWKISQLSSSLMGLLRPQEPDTKHHEQVELIRQVLLDCMAGTANGQPGHPIVWSRVKLAPDIQALWYLRSDVMHTLSHHYGESEASDKLNAITELFESHLPTAQFASFRRRGSPSCAPMKRGP